MRCMMGAIGVAIINTLLYRFGVRITFGSLAALTAAFSPLLVVEWIWGKHWRLARDAGISSKKTLPI